MPALRLRSDATFGLLIADLCVLSVAADTAFDSEHPTPVRVVFLVVGVLALAFAVHSVVALRRQRRT